MRGAHGYPDFAPNGGRIIPADAGSTNADLEGQAAGRDHPRRCGEHDQINGLWPELGGSSPQMRGAQFISKNA